MQWAANSAQRKIKTMHQNTQLRLLPHIWAHLLMLLISTAQHSCRAFSPQSRVQLKSAVDVHNRCIKKSLEGDCSNRPHRPSWILLQRSSPLNMQQASTSAEYEGVIVVALYKFVPLTVPQCKEMQQALKALMLRLSMKGYVRIATEGFNGTVVGTRNSLDIFNAELESLQSRFGVSGKGGKLIYKESWHPYSPMKKIRVRITPEIVTLRQDVNPIVEGGEYVDPSDWNAAMKGADVVIDVRNDYEVEMGTFAGAVNPKTKTFAEFARFVDDNLTPDQSVAMFCTGGIRCEKASAFLKGKGFGTVSHLRGGILQYFKDVPSDRSEWKGECFLFDQRWSVTHDEMRSSDVDSQTEVSAPTVNTTSPKL